TDSFWSIMNAIFGWRNQATVDTTVSYFVYWLFVIITAVIIILRSRKPDNNDTTEQTDTIEQIDINEKVATQLNSV
ncbi:1500_t:CDS:1, partial [Dentiscutata heterogama]